jgi:hypothetical protein
MDEVDSKLNDLSSRFEDRRAAIGDRLLTHKSNIDILFSTYYKVLDDMKEDLLKDEMIMLSDLKNLDHVLDKLSHEVSCYDLWTVLIKWEELYKIDIAIKTKLDDYNEYMPT